MKTICSTNTILSMLVVSTAVGSCSKTVGDWCSTVTFSNRRIN